MNFSRNHKILYCADTFANHALFSRICLLVISYRIKTRKIYRFSSNALKTLNPHAAHDFYQNDKTFDIFSKKRKSRLIFR